MIKGLGGAITLPLVAVSYLVGFVAGRVTKAFAEGFEDAQ